MGAAGCDMACCEQAALQHKGHGAEHNNTIQLELPDCCAGPHPSPCTLETPVDAGQVKYVATQTRSVTPSDTAGVIFSTDVRCHHFTDNSLRIFTHRIAPRKLPPLYLQHHSFLV